MKANINDTEIKEMNETKKSTLQNLIFDENIIQQIFIKLVFAYNLEEEKRVFFEINDNFKLVCKLFSNILKQNLFNFNFNDINFNNIPYDTYLRLKYISSSKFSNSNIDDLLFNSCYEGFYHLIDILIQNQANINCIKSIYPVTDALKTPLIISVECKEIKTIKKLLEYKNLDINYQDCYKNTALVIACFNGYEDIISLLLEKKDLDVNLQNSDEESPLMIACYEEYLTIVSLLIQRKDLDLNLTDYDGNSALIDTCRFGSKDIVSLLIQRKDLDLNLTDPFGSTALMTAISYGNKDIVSLLLSRKDLDLNLKNNNNKTALDIAKSGDGKSHQKIVQILNKSKNF